MTAEATTPETKRCPLPSTATSTDTRRRIAGSAPKARSYPCRDSRVRSRRSPTTPSTTVWPRSTTSVGSAGQDDVPDIDKNIAGHGRTAARQGAAHHELGGRVPPSQQIEPYLQDLVERRLDDMMAEAAVNGDEGVDVVRHLAAPVPPAAMSAPVRLPGVRLQGVRAVVSVGGRAVRAGGREGREHPDGRPQPGAARLRRRQDRGAPRVAAATSGPRTRSPGSSPPRSTARRSSRGTSVRRSCS